MVQAIHGVCIASRVTHATKPVQPQMLSTEDTGNAASGLRLQHWTSGPGYLSLLPIWFRLARDSSCLWEDSTRHRA